MCTWTYKILYLNWSDFQKTLVIRIKVWLFLKSIYIKYFPQCFFFFDGCTFCYFIIIFSSWCKQPTYIKHIMCNLIHSYRHRVSFLVVINVICCNGYYYTRSINVHGVWCHLFFVRSNRKFSVKFWNGFYVNLSTSYWNTITPWGTLWFIRN